MTIDTNISRRNFLKAGAVVGTAPLFLGLAGCQVEPQEVFAHGVASGDPLADRVIIWTRVSLPEELDNYIDIYNGRDISVNWEVATSPSFADVVQSGVAQTNINKDFTVKVDVTGLLAYTTYYYRFSVEGVESQWGRTKTLPVDTVEQINIAFTSCSHHAFGYFNVYEHISKMDDLDVVLHLGDYIYEYGEDDAYRNVFLAERQHIPAKEMVSLDEYRIRHGQYKLDADSQKMHARHPVIAIWDDHEFTNDTWRNGAENHDESEGDFASRAQRAIQAYYEWMPIREPSANGAREKAWRQFSFGNLLDLNMLDTRFYGRDEQPAEFNGELELEERSLLGYEQEAWLTQNLKNAQANGTKWKFLGQQVQMMQIQLFGNYINSDSWDGYQQARKRVLDSIKDNGIDNVIVLTGDVHSSWAAELTNNPYDENEYNPDTSAGAVAVELVTPSVTSPTIPVEGLQQIAGDAGKILQIKNKHIKYIDFKNRGFVRMEITAEKVRANWHHVPFVAFKNDYTYVDKSFEIFDGKPQLLERKLASNQGNKNTDTSIMSFNLRYNEPNDGVNQWNNRKETIISMLNDRKPKIIGIQEGLADQVAYLDANLPNYAYVGVGRDNGVARGEYAAIFYATEQYDLLESNHFWLSETPDTPSLGWDANNIRMVTWVKLFDKALNKPFYVFNTHFDHMGTTAQRESSKLLVSKINELADTSLPIFITGDFNLLAIDLKLKALNDNFSNAQKSAINTDHLNKSFNAFGRFGNSLTGLGLGISNIDHIFFNNAQAITYETVAEDYGVPYISDHYPIMAYFDYA